MNALTTATSTSPHRSARRQEDDALESEVDSRGPDDRAPRAMRRSARYNRGAEIVSSSSGSAIMARISPTRRADGPDTVDLCDPALDVGCRPIFADLITCARQLRGARAELAVRVTVRDKMSTIYNASSARSSPS